MNNQKDNELWKQLIVLIKSAAEKQNIRPSKIADHANVSRSTVTRILDMKFCPKSNILFSMAEAVNIKIEFKNG